MNFPSARTVSAQTERTLQTSPGNDFVPTNLTGESPRDATTTASSIVGAVLMPHAPILVPAVGGSRGEASAASSRAMRAAANKALSLHPETVVLVSPHSPRKSGAFGLWADDLLQGSFEQFGAPQARVKLPHDPQLVSAIAAAAHAQSLKTWNLQRHALDHGALVPLWFLAEAGWAGPTVVTSLNYPDEGGRTEWGEAIAAAAKTLRRRIVLIASGDMSHRLTAEAPCGFHPQAHQFDETFIRLIRAGDYRALPTIPAGLRELAAEDAVDSTVIAAAAVDWSAAGHEVLNYECPFGVGYGVAILFAREAETPRETQDAHAGQVLPGIARSSVAAALRGSSAPAPPADGGYLTAAHGVFVTIHRRDGKLRGCIGTIAPTCANVVKETWRSARLAALDDYRFPSVTARELPQLRFEVSVLHPPEEIQSASELDPQRYGVIVSTTDGRRGLLLPRIEGITTAEQQVSIARRKGGIDAEEPVKLERFEVDHFEEA
jgi:MEMO1 family protein